jgi:hypothetical protein
MKNNFTKFRSACLLAAVFLSFATGELKAQMSGSYTIGAGGNYPSFRTAVSDLVAVGVTGPVVFNVFNGTYTDSITIPEIVGSSAVNTITFQSQVLDSIQVTLTFPSQGGAANNYCVRLNGADNIIFNEITISRTGLNPWSAVLVLEAQATNNVVRNCRLIGPLNGTTHAGAALVGSSGSNDSMNLFTNSLFRQGGVGIQCVGSFELNNTITNNVFENQLGSAISLTSQLDAIITGNTITSTSTNTGYTAIYCEAAQRQLVIVKNKITSIIGKGVWLADCNGYGVFGNTSNNFIQCRDSGIVVSGVSGGTDQDIAANSIHCTGTNSKALVLSGPMSRVSVIDNALVNSGGGLSYEIRGTGGVGVTSNYNDLYTTGANVGMYLGTLTPTLADWVSASGNTLDVTSVSVDPVFVSVTDLHATSGAFDNLGNLAGLNHVVSDDIDNQLRSGSFPDIGADEFSAAALHDVSIFSLVSPSNNDCEDATATVSARVCNNGSFSETNFPVSVSGAITQTVIYTGTLAVGACDTITFSTTVNTSGGGIFNFNVYSGLAADVDRANDTIHRAINILPNAAPPTAFGVTICTGDSAALTATPSTVSWYLDPTGGVAVGTGSPFNTGVLDSTTTYYVQADGPCPSTRTAVTVTVNPLPVVNLGNDTSFIAGNSITLDAGAGFSFYIWSTSDFTQTISLTPVGDTCVNVIVTDGNNCSNRDTICITLIFPTDVGISALLFPIDGQCEDSLTPVTVQISNYGTASVSNICVTVILSGLINDTLTGNYSATINIGNSATFTFPDSINTLGGGTITITSYTCLGSDQSTGNDTLVSVITINAVPDEPVGSSSTRCGPGPITVSATGSQTIYWYNASTGGSNIAVGSTFTDVNALSTYSVWAQAGSTCPSLTRTEVVLTVNPLPVVILPGDSTIACGDSINVDAGSGFVTYQWSNGDTTQSSTIAVDTSGTGAGDYWVIVTDTNGCQNSDTMHVDCITGYNLLSMAIEITVYPNPSSGKVELTVSSKSSSGLIIRWMDVSGQIISEDKVSNAASVVHRKYDMSDAAKGMYFVQIISSEGVATKKVILE